MNAFAAILADCRERFHGGRGDLLRAEADPFAGEAVPHALADPYRTLLDRGHVVWGAVAQVNRGIFEPGPDDLPGVTVYSTDDHFDDHPQDLLAIGQALYDLKGTEPVDADLRQAADRMTDEYDMTLRRELPARLSDGRLVHVGATLFHRGRLPGGVLQARLLPLVIAREWTDVNMTLPLLCWPAGLRDVWAALDARLAALKTTSTARRVAQAAAKKPAGRGAAWATERRPVRVTAEAARVFREAVRRYGLPEPAYLCVGLRPDGTTYADVGESYDPAVERCYDADGIRVVVRHDQLGRMRGTTIDYREGLWGSGFVVRLADEP